MMTPKQTKELERLQLMQQQDKEEIDLLQSRPFNLDDEQLKYLVTAIRQVSADYKGTKVDDFVMALLSFLEDRRQGKQNVKEWLEEKREMERELAND